MKKYKTLLSNAALILLSLIIINNFGYKYKFDYIILMYTLSIFLLKTFLGRVILYFIIFVSFFYLPISWYYGSPNISLAASLIETQSYEAVGFIMDYGIYFILFFISLLGITIFLLKFTIKNFKINHGFLILIVVISIGVLFKGYSKISVNDHNIYEKLSKLRIVPISFFSDSIAIFFDYERELELRKKLSMIAPSWTVSQTHNLNEEIKIMVIGESVRRDFMNVYGFPLKNTPFSSSSKGIFWDNFISAGSNTVSSLKHMLTLHNGIVPELNNNVVTLAQKGGYDVYWLSNQGRLGVNDTYISAIAAYSDYEYFARKGEFNDRVINDRVLLPEFEKVLKNKGKKKNKLIILHLIDSHPPFCNTIEKLKFEYISHKLSCYVQRIHNTDRLLNELVKLTKSEVENYSLLYFSDHGLVARDNGTNLKHGGGHAEQEAYKAPLFLIGSKYKQKVHIDAFKNGYQLIFGIAEWLGIKTKQNTDHISFFDSIDIEPMIIRNKKFIELNSLQSDEFDILNID